MSPAMMRLLGMLGLLLASAPALAQGAPKAAPPPAVGYGDYVSAPSCSVLPTSCPPGIQPTPGQHYVIVKATELASVVVSPNFKWPDATIVSSWQSACGQEARKTPFCRVDMELWVPGGRFDEVNALIQRLLPTRISMQLGQWRRIDDHRIEVQTKSGAWLPFPAEGMTMALTRWGRDADGAIVYVPRARLEEFRKLVREEIPPHRWHALDEPEIFIDFLGSQHQVLSRVCAAIAEGYALERNPYV
jgi:hypothetical protein